MPPAFFGENRRHRKRGNRLTVVNITYAIVESQVDWLTLTRPSSLEDDRLLNLGEVIMHEQAKTDPSISQWSWKGYSGKRGEHFAFGRRYDSDILQLSSDVAAKWFDAAWQRAAKCTRIDLAVTVRYDGGREWVARDGYQQGLDWNAQHGRGPERTLIVNGRGGSTAYLGTRTSDLYARLYDKWRESGDERYRYCWRWEVEAKADIAGRIGHRLSASVDRPSDVANIVATHFVRRGVCAEWMEGRDTGRIETVRRPSGTLSRLGWLDKSVRPVIERLLPLVSEEEILEALGLERTAIDRARVRRSDFFGGHTLEEETD